MNEKITSIVKARKEKRTHEEKLAEIREKLLYNLECEKAGVPLPYTWVELHEEAETARTEAKKVVDELPDALADMARDVFPKLKGNGELIQSGTRIVWKTTIKRAVVDLWDTSEHTPDKAPELWEDLGYKKGYRIIPEVITVGLAFAKDECGWWNDTLYKSNIDSNVWTPDAYPTGWSKV